MTTPILMPALSPTMEVGKLVKWHVKEGDTVRSGDVIAEIETDKATMEVEAVDEGRIGKLLVAEGTEHVPVNQPIATLLTDDDSAASEGTRATTSSPFSINPTGAGSRCLGRVRHAQDRRADQGERRRTVTTSASSPRLWRGGLPASAASSSPRLQALARTAAS